MRFPNYKEEWASQKNGYTYAAGCDEAGRGPLAGPVIAAACILNPISVDKKEKWCRRVRDSKTIREKERETLSKEIRKNAVALGIGAASVKEIDRLNIHHASLLAMRRATEAMLRKMRKAGRGKIKLFVDGRFKIPGLKKPGLGQKSVIDGDAKILSISAASIIAKVERDKIMRALDAGFPKYGFGRHKGYGTKEHKSAIKKFGITRHHRRSFHLSTSGDTARKNNLSRKAK